MVVPNRTYEITVVLRNTLPREARDNAAAQRSTYEPLRKQSHAAPANCWLPSMGGSQLRRFLVYISTLGLGTWSKRPILTTVTARPISEESPRTSGRSAVCAHGRWTGALTCLTRHDCRRGTDRTGWLSGTVHLFDPAMALPSTRFGGSTHQPQFSQNQRSMGTPESVVVSSYFLRPPSIFTSASGRIVTYVPPGSRFSRHRPCSGQHSSSHRHRSAACSSGNGRRSCSPSLGLRLEWSPSRRRSCTFRVEASRRTEANRDRGLCERGASARFVVVAAVDNKVTAVLINHRSLSMWLQHVGGMDVKLDALQPGLDRRRHTERRCLLFPSAKRPSLVPRHSKTQDAAIHVLEAEDASILHHRPCRSPVSRRRTEPPRRARGHRRHQRPKAYSSARHGEAPALVRGQSSACCGRWKLSPRPGLPCLPTSPVDRSGAFSHSHEPSRPRCISGTTLTAS